jgi:hypothetical protein
VDEETKRLAFQITINGKPYFESEDVTVITMVVEQIRRGGGHRISLHASAGEAQLQGLAASFAVGDEVVIKIVDVSDIQEADPRGCSFCGRQVHEVSSLVQGLSTAICDRCITSISAAVKTGSPLPTGASIRDEPDWSCGFCGNQPGSVPGVVVRNGAAVCPEYLRACADILSDSIGR